MNPDLDKLFEAARQSLKADMPVEELRELVQGHSSTHFWNHQKFWIMSSSIIAIITISSFLFWNTFSDSSKTPELQPKTTLSTQLPTLPPSSNTASLPSEKWVPQPDWVASTAPAPTLALATFDSLIPKETFREYKLEIRKENSEQEIKKLSAELAQYGIVMQVDQLDYDKQNKIKKFKGSFKTDSLFCGRAMEDHEFDISGAFQKIEFIFRVADQKQLKYLKIQSDGFEETIECYKDPVLSDAKEAELLQNEISEEMAKARASMQLAREEMMRAQQELTERFRSDKFNQQQRKTLEHIAEIDWERFSKNIEQQVAEALKGLDNQIANLDEKQLESLEKLKEIDWSAFEKDLEEKIEQAMNAIDWDAVEKNIETSLEKMEEELEKIGEELELNIESEIRAQLESELDPEEAIPSAKEMREEAKELMRAAKDLKKAAKRQAAEERRNRRNT